MLLGCAALALLWANSPWSGAYGLLHTFQMGFHLGPVHLPHSPAHWINDGLMAVFFLLVGLEIKREMTDGELSRPEKLALPAFAALGGMLVPAAIYWGFNRGGPAAAGWGIPMATDIAFALGILSLLGKRAPAGLKVFLAALAILDDLGAVVVIALFYGGALNMAALGIGAALFASLLFLNRFGVRHLSPYLVLGAALWLATLASGIHATVAGVLVALSIPARPGAPDGDSPLTWLEQTLHPWVAFGILPLFALVNAGVTLDPTLVAGLVGPLSLGVQLGLLLGKPVGILLFSRLVVALRLGVLPTGVGWNALAGCACLGGIGFTMSLFIAGLGLGEGRNLEQAKLAILVGSTLSGVLGWTWLRMLAAPDFQPAESGTEETQPAKPDRTIRPG